MSFASWHPDGTATIYLRGDLDIATAPALQIAIDDVLSAGARRLVFDGRRVEFIDLRGVHPLLYARRRLQAADDEIRVWLHQPAACMRRLLSVTGLDGVLPSLA